MRFLFNYSLQLTTKARIVFLKIRLFFDPYCLASTVSQVYNILYLTLRKTLCNSVVNQSSIFAFKNALRTGAGISLSSPFTAFQMI